MFDVGWDEMLFTAVIAIIVIGPKDMPAALRTAGRWIGKMRRVSGHFRSGIHAMIRQAELEEMEKKWREQNEAIMQAHPDAIDPPAPVSAEAAVIRDGDARIDPARINPARDDPAESSAEPQLPLPPR